MRIVIKIIQLITLALLMGFSSLQAQSYDELMNQAGAALQAKDYCKALPYFKTAFKDSSKIGTYDLAYAGVAAANCQEEQLALQWLAKSQQKGLGMNPGEIDYIANDSGFIKLRNFPEWTNFVNAMRKAFADKQAFEQKRSEEWVNTIKNNAILTKNGKKFRTAKTGFALYFSKVDTLNVPYLVYVPKNYSTEKPIKAIVYLHGGVVNANDFAYQNPDLGTGEPIFSMGDTFNTIIIYPFAKKDFGWVNQKAAFENVLTVVAAVNNTYNISDVYLGGMSNGGTATFWFAAQKNNPFSGFYAISAMPKLEIGTIDFSSFNQQKPCVTLHAKDDDLYKYDEVLKIYDDNKAAAKDWQFTTAETGGHGLIYQQNGREVLKNLLAKIGIRK
jgi:poly(3-hydroxybutyrate) depolymerase